MMRTIGTVMILALAAGTARADDAKAKDATATLDKAIAALGGADKLGKAKAFTMKSKAKISIMGNDVEMTMKTTSEGLDKLRGEFEGDFGGMPVQGVIILAGDKGWRKFGDMGMEMDEAAIANEKRNNYMAAAATRILPLKGEGFKVAAADEIKIDGKPAAGVLVTGPDKKTFTIYFDKATGLPARMKAQVVDGFSGQEFDQETNYSEYKDFDGIKRATKMTVTRNGEKFLTQEISEYKVLDKVPEGTFAEPK